MDPIATLDRVHRLLALAQSSNPYESAVALKKARILLGCDEDPPSLDTIPVVDVEHSIAPDDPLWIRRLHALVCRWWGGESLGMVRRGSVAFVGCREHASAVRKRFLALRECIHRTTSAWQQMRQPRGLDQRECDSYALGQVARLAERHRRLPAIACRQTDPIHRARRHGIDNVLRRIGASTAPMTSDVDLAAFRAGFHAREGREDIENSDVSNRRVFRQHPRHWANEPYSLQISPWKIPRFEDSDAAAVIR